MTTLLLIGISLFISLFCFLLGMGFATGATLVFVVKKGKVRNPMIALAWWLFGGIVAYGALMYGQYVDF